MSPDYYLMLQELLKTHYSKRFNSVDADQYSKQNLSRF